MEKPSYIFFIYTAFFILTAIFSFLINGLLLKFSSSLGMRPGMQPLVRWSVQAKPSVGGISFFIIFLFSIVIHSIFFGHANGVLNINFIGQIIAITMAFLIGLADDAYNTNPILKFIAQVLCGITLIATGTHIAVFESNILNYVLTLLWIVAIMNSINMLDNMDAITSVVSIGIIVSAMFVLYFNYDLSHIHFFILMGVMASLIGFLFYNWYPAKIYMGDTGSQFLGILLGIIGISYFWNGSAAPVSSQPLKQLILVSLVFILPITDTATVVLNRLLKKKSPFVGGRDHTTHYLSYMGLSDSQVAFLYLFIGLISAFLVLIIIKYLPVWNTICYLLFITYIAAISCSLFYVTKLKRKDKSNVEEPE